ncbi:O-antigen ligase family protein [Zobellia galactanivorans]|uniref:O-antigen ligase family protein n=1 Tax=Zobellia galactanivorans (strain DSM 12802 / CCUG 47099 / CIP 106680 / NCIMB 13871 / Dsij) TaxID=63186 RepID=UPI001C06D24C|nr:O-antigen ligase family protein [Zobellia galactanivorans]MBU3024414.1 O-antigen ligase family protein [Zobellia galactanivorans]
MLNIPDFALTHINPVISSLLSYLSFGLLILFYLINKRTGANMWLLFIGVIYFIIGSFSGQTYIPPLNFYLVFWIKYFIIIICGYELVKRTTPKELSIFLLIGAITIILQIFFFNNPLKDYGRYSGFYLNPNSGGFICILGYSLTYALKNKQFRFIAQWIFTLMGLLTFSRTFILLWVLINLISIRISVKNVNKLLLGAGLLFVLMAYNSFLPVKNDRLSQLTSVLSGDTAAAQDLNEGSRFETWEKFYGYIMKKPVFGNGFNAFDGGGLGGFLGAHNTYLKLLGEAGILPFLLFLLFFLSLIRKSLSHFNEAPYILFMTISLAILLLTSHNFFDSGYLLLATLWIYTRIELYNGHELKNEDIVLEN